MRKFAKMSLVAAVAVAAMTTANAKDLTEAIKGVDVSGTVAYRYEEANADTTAQEQENYYNAVLDMVVPAGDNLTMGLSFQAGIGKLNTSTAQDADLNVMLTGANFSYTGIANTTITAGKQAIPTPWTVASDAMGATHSGTGILALATFSPVTIAAAYFNQTNISALGNGDDIAVLGALANFSGVNLEAFYANSEDNFDSYTVAAGYKADFDGVKLGLSARYTELSPELAGVFATNKDQETTQGKITLAAAGFNAMVAYGENGKDGGLVSFDGSAKTTMEAWNTGLGSNADTEFLKTSLGYKVMPELHVSLNYNDQDEKLAANDRTETYVQVKYKASKNLSTYIRYGELEVADKDGEAGRLHIQYTF